jgi:Lamin Tail Domain/Glucodextranase, domain B
MTARGGVPVRMLAGAVVPEVCIPTWVGVVFAIAAISVLALLVRSRWHRRREQRVRPERVPWSRGDWIGLVGLLLSVAVAVAGFVHCPMELPEVRISLADSRLNPAEYDDASDEYVCLVNYDDQPVSMAGWEIHAAERRINVLPDFTLQPGAAVRVHPGSGTNSTRDLYGEKGSPEWRNEGGQISLLDSEGQEVDAVGYGERNDGDGSGECGPSAKVAVGLALKITSPDEGETVESPRVTIRGTVTSGSVVRAEIDHDDEGELGGEEARVVSGDGVDHFTVDVRLDPGENHIRVWAEKPGAEPVIAAVGVIRKKVEPPPPPPPPCDPNYEGACLDPNATDYDCAGGEGDGPEYVEGPITIVGEDRFDLGANEDGVACEP